jgi:hypothetical protein
MQHPGIKSDTKSGVSLLHFAWELDDMIIVKRSVYSLFFRVEHFLLSCLRRVLALGSRARVTLIIILKLIACGANAPRVHTCHFIVKIAS